MTRRRAKPASAMPDWAPLFVLPNVSVVDDEHVTTPEIAFGLGTAELAIAGAADPRVIAISAWSPTWRHLLAAYRDEYGKPAGPAVLIGRNDWLRRNNKDPEPIVAFRNAVAMSHCLASRAQDPFAGRRGPFWADSFTMHPAQLSLGGDSVYVITPAITHHEVPLQQLRFSADPGLPRVVLSRYDPSLAESLGVIWRLRFLQRKKVRPARALFRSLEIAYHAASLRHANYSSPNDAGLTAAMWVSALEILASPWWREGKQTKVSQGEVLDLLGQTKWTHQRLQRRPYRIPLTRKNKKVTQWRSLNLGQVAYTHLYTARNKFLHGDRAPLDLLRPFGSKRPPILAFGPTLYWAALRAFIDRNWRLPEDELGPNLMLSWLTARDHERVLLSAVQDEDEMEW